MRPCFFAPDPVQLDMSPSWIVLSGVSGVSFIIYGVSCLGSAHMRAEFQRYGLARFRSLVGWLEILGGGAQLFAGWVPLLGLLASGGLTLLMGLGVLTRIRIRDPLGPTLPAIAYLLLNAYLFFGFLS